jgi:hypothetical protein
VADQAVTGAASDRPLDETRPVIEYMVQTRRTWGTRVYADGEAEEWVDDRSGWRPLVRVPSGEVTALLEFARDEGFFALPSDLDPASDAEDRTTVRWTLEREGQRHSVQAAGGQSQPLLLALNDRLQLAVGHALNRKADTTDTG